MALGSHLITVRRLEKYINDVIGKKANLPDTSKTIIGNISQINSDLSDMIGVDITNQITLAPISPSAYSAYTVRKCIYYPSLELAYLDILITMGSTSKITAGTSRIINIMGNRQFVGVISGPTVVNSTSDNNPQYGLIGQLSSAGKLFLTPQTNNDFKASYTCALAGIVRCITT